MERQGVVVHLQRADLLLVLPQHHAQLLDLLVLLLLLLQLAVLDLHSALQDVVLLLELLQLGEDGRLFLRAMMGQAREEGEESDLHGSLARGARRGCRRMHAWASPGLLAPSAQWQTC